MLYISITNNDREATVLKNTVLFSLDSNPQIDGKRCYSQFRKLIISSRSIKRPYSTYESLTPSFTKWLATDDVTVVVSTVDPIKLNPLLGSSFESVLAMLILTSPEVRWLFSSIRGYSGVESNDESSANKSDGNKLDSNDNRNSFRQSHGLHLLFQPYQSTLFDGAGLRDWIRRVTKENKETRRDACYLPRRKQIAIALDEETNYAYLHAYIAFRFGFRALAISEKSAADAVLNQPVNERTKQIWGIPFLVFEDLFLNFPDGGGGLSQLEKREESFPQLKDATYRFVVTSDQQGIGAIKNSNSNDEYICSQKEKGKKIEFIYKPHAGIFAVSGQVEIKAGKLLNWSPLEIQSSDKKNLKINDHIGGTGHSSPGIFLSIACALLSRAEIILANNTQCVKDAVYGAVLATDALELLGGKTPTCAARALSLKHQLELHAECQFSGVKHHVNVTQRFTEIQRDAKSIAKWFKEENKQEAEWNIQLKIVNKLISILRQYNQLDEELEYLCEVRKLHNSLYLSEKPSWCRWALWAPLRYSEILLRSFWNFLCAITIWLTGLSALYFYVDVVPCKDKDITEISFAIETAMKSFLGNSPVISCDFWPAVIGFVAIVAGFVHLGIIISYMYVKVTKR